MMARKRDAGGDGVGSRCTERTITNAASLPQSYIDAGKYCWFATNRDGELIVVCFVVGIAKQAKQGQAQDVWMSIDVVLTPEFCICSVWPVGPALTGPPQGESGF